MNNRRSYLDSMNAGRRRRTSTSLDDLNHSLDELESRIRRPTESDYRSHTQRLAGEAAWYDAPGRERDRERRAPARDARAAHYNPPSRESGSAAVAEELGALREELRQQMGVGLSREFAALKAEIDRALHKSWPTAQVAELGAEFDRLSGMIHKLADRSDDRQINMLRLEMEEVKSALGKLAREETVQSFDRRWDELDRRWSDMASQVSDRADPAALHALSTRLEQIADAVNALPTSVSLRSLEDRMKILASAVDQFAHHQDRIGPEALDAIEGRLDEISRALAAASRPASVDPEPFERIEARISSLARQIGEIVEENSASVGLADQLVALSHRVEDIAHRVDLPDQTIERLATQIDIISRKLDDGPALPDLDRAFHGLESRFASLSSMLEQRQEDALAQGQALFRDLENRLGEVALRIDRSETHRPADDTRLLEAMDARFSELATRLERQAAAPANDGSIRDLEARLDAMSNRIETSALQPGVDSDLIRSLEAQIAGLASHLSQPAMALPEMEEIRPRLDKIEQSIADGRQDVMEAARHAAEEAVRAFAGSGMQGGEGALVTALADDLKALEQLGRKSDDRNAKTFEAIHDTLLKIVDRLGAVEAGAAEARAVVPAPKPGTRETLLGPEQTPSLEPEVEGMPIAPVSELADNDAATGRRTAAVAAAEAAAAAMRSETELAEEVGGGRRSMLGGLSKVFSSRKRKQAEEAKPAEEPVALAGDTPAPAVELDAPLDPRAANQPLEPGSGAPDLNAIMRRVRDERGQPGRGADAETAKSDFIAAARRAAQAAAAEAEMMKRGPATKSKKGGLGGLFKSRRKPILMGVAAVLIALAALQFGKSFSSGGQSTAQAPAPASAPVVAEAIDAGGVARVEDAELLPLEPDVGQPVRVVDEAPARTAQSAMTSAPETSDDVSTAWLDSTASLPEPEMQAEAAAADTFPADEAPQEMQIEIPAEAGPAALREAAEVGDPRALFEIGNRYAEGRGVAEDMASAAEWYERAAEQGLAPAQYRIGNLYEKGVGKERDIARAKTWYQLAAAQGNASAMHNLAVLHAMGADGVTDNETAVRWFVQAAELGVTDSQFNLGILAAKGVGMEQNLEEAYKWFALVGRSGDKDAVDKRDEVANALRPEQLEQARAAAELWRAKEADPEANTVDIPESWGESADTTASVDMRQVVRNIQHILNRNGYEAGAEDGMIGNRTKTAIAAFQSDNGMTPTGELDEPLVRALLDRR